MISLNKIVLDKNIMRLNYISSKLQCFTFETMYNFLFFLSTLINCNNSRSVLKKFITLFIAHQIVQYSGIVIQTTRIVISVIKI